MAFFARRFSIKLAGDREADQFETWLSFEVNKSTVCDSSRFPPMEAGNGFYSSIMTFQSLQNMPDPRPAMQKLNLPVLVMKGQCDNQPWGFTREYLSLFRSSRLVVIPQAGHFIDLEQPGLYLDAISRFLARSADQPGFH